MNITLRPETEQDYRTIEELTREAFWNVHLPGCEEHLLVHHSNTAHTVLTFGPVSVLPQYQNRGIGTALIEHTQKLAAGLGYRAIIIYGDPEYYRRFGFKASKEFRITNGEGKYPAALLALELYPGALADIQGKFDEGKAYHIDPQELEEFEKGFVKKEKLTAKSQKRFAVLSQSYL